MSSQAKISNTTPLRDIPLQFIEVEGLRFAYRIAPSSPDQSPVDSAKNSTIKKSPTILFLHGWPLNGLTYEHVINHLSHKYTCITVDLPGLGHTPWNHSLDLSPKGQSRLLDIMMGKLGFSAYAIYGNDSGGMVARHLAALSPKKITHLILSNTEIPHERPPWLPLYKQSLKVPGVALLMRKILSFDPLVSTPILLGGVFQDKTLLRGTFKRDFIHPLLHSTSAFSGAICSFHEICNWPQLDALVNIHPALNMPTLFVWGKQDPTFPLSSAKKMMSQFPNKVELREIEGAKLFVHQEKPKEVSNEIAAFMEK